MFFHRTELETENAINRYLHPHFLSASRNMHLVSISKRFHRLCSKCLTYFAYRTKLENGHPLTVICSTSSLHPFLALFLSVSQATNRMACESHGYLSVVWTFNHLFCMDRYYQSCKTSFNMFQLWSGKRWCISDQCFDCFDWKLPDANPIFCIRFGPWNISTLWFNLSNLIFPSMLFQRYVTRQSMKTNTQPHNFLSFCSSFRCILSDSTVKWTGKNDHLAG